jgi:hypothetical protein
MESDHVFPTSDAGAVAGRVAGADGLESFDFDEHPHDSANISAMHITFRTTG